LLLVLFIAVPFALLMDAMGWWYGRKIKRDYERLLRRK
jgi:hypothetical protein